MGGIGLAFLVKRYLGCGLSFDGLGHDAAFLGSQETLTAVWIVDRSQRRQRVRRKCVAVLAGG